VRNDGVGVVRSDEVGRTGLLGPIARASGSATDRRVNDPVYVALGFEPLTRHEGDARARALLRAEEATQSLELAAALLNGTPAGAGAWEPATRATVEGPRGPVRVTHGECVVLGSDEAMHAAEIAAVGLEWSSALVAIASFDLAPGGLER
jgi:Ni,Fe-hydrogenase III large subunit